MELAAGNAHIFNGRMFLWVVDEKCSFVSYFSRKRDSQKDGWNARKIYNSVIIKSLFLCIVVSTETSIFWEGKNAQLGPVLIIESSTITRHFGPIF